MTIITVALTTRSGKAIFSRQFVEITRMRVEALLAGFPKLLSPAKLQQQYIDAEHVRYLFQPMDNLFLLMITTRNSNIVEDLDTLRLLAKVVADACSRPSEQILLQQGSGLTEELVLEAVFDIVAALDEVVSCGYREPNLTLALIRANLEMNSHEEKLSQMIRQTKETDAKQEMRRQAAAIHAKKESSAGAGGMGMQGFGNTASAYAASQAAAAAAMATPVPAFVESAAASATAASKPTIGKQGMKLVKKQRDVTEALLHEDGMEVESEVVALGAAASSSAAAVASLASANKDPVFCLVNEQVSCTIQQDGRVSAYQVQGQISLISRQADQAFVVQLSPDCDFKRFAFKPHPQVDKQRLERAHCIALKQQDRSLPVNTAFGAVKYYSNPSTTGNLVESIPLNLTVWPESAGGASGVMNVNLEYELGQQAAAGELVNVLICIPLGTSASGEPEVVNCSAGTYRHNAKRNQLEWTIDSVSRDASSGNLEFNLAKSEPATFFPTAISFSSSQSLAGVRVESVLDAQSGAPIRFGAEVHVTTDVYEVVNEE